MMNSLRLSVLSFLIAGCAATHVDPLTPAAERDSLKFLTVNVWSGLDYKGYLRMGEYETAACRRTRRDILVQQIREIDPDVVALQEANKLPHYALDLAKELGYAVFYHVGIGGIRLGPVGIPSNLREGDVILAKKDLYPESAGRRRLSGGHVGNFLTFHFDDATQIIGVKLKFHGRPIYVFTTHWHASLWENEEIKQRITEYLNDDNADERAVNRFREAVRAGQAWRFSEAKKTVDFIRRTAGVHPFVLMGDFNAQAESEEINVLMESGMKDAYRELNPDAEGFTWNPQQNSNIRTHYFSKTVGEDNGLFAAIDEIAQVATGRIDFIFVGPAAMWQKEIKPNHCSVVMDKLIDGMHTSDHFGILAEIQFVPGGYPWLK